MIRSTKFHKAVPVSAEEAAVSMQKFVDAQQSSSLMSISDGDVKSAALSDEKLSQMKVVIEALKQH